MKSYRIMILLLIFVMLFSSQTFFSRSVISETPINQREESDTPVAQKMSMPCSVNETTAVGPEIIPYDIWGWVANLSFSYYELEGYVGISGANVTCSLAQLAPTVFDLDNGTYLVEVNTTMLQAEYDIPYTLIVRFEKTGYENQVLTRNIFVFPIPTELTIIAPTVNQLDGYPWELVIPLGDSIDILLLYNATTADNSIGIIGAHVDATIIGPTLVAHDLEPVELGDGAYLLNLNTSEEWLYESNDGIPIAHKGLYYLTIEVFKENAEPTFDLVRFIMELIPTKIAVLSGLENSLLLQAGMNGVLVSLIDLWHDGVQVQDVNITAESSDRNLLEVVSITESSSEPGVYEITLHNKAPIGGDSEEVYAYVTLTIAAEKERYERDWLIFRIGLLSPVHGCPPPQPTIGFPALIVVLVCSTIVYIRNRRKMSSAATPAGND